MDFGKKGDAKKAMKLKWKKGISLKAAWKLVKGKDSKKKRPVSSKKRKSKSLKQSKVQAMAKKAMKLKWREGISLKQAWKRVNKFGDAVCPQGYEPNPFFTGSGSSRRRPCLKECEMSYMRDPSTGRCRKMTDRPRGNGKKSPPSGYEIGPSGRMRKICPIGSYRDPVTGRCKKIKSVYPQMPILDMDFGGRYERKHCNTGKFGTCKVCKFGTCKVCSMK